MRTTMGRLTVVVLGALVLAPLARPAAAGPAPSAPAAATPTGTLTATARPAATATPATRLRAPVAPPQPTAEEIAELGRLEKDYQRYQRAARDYRQTIDHIVRRAYLRKIKDVKARYERQIKAEEADLQRRRLDAIRLFERFLRRHPNHPTHTPNAIFRLAELYYEVAFENYVLALDNFPQQQEDYAKALATGKSPDELPPVPQPSADYDKVATLYRRLLVRFPDYRNIDATHYLLGYVLITQEAKTRDEARGRQAFLALLCHNKYRALDEPAPRERPRMQPKPSEPLGIPDPYVDCQPLDPKSRYLPELWTRVGEDHFHVGELVLAMYAFRRVLALKDHELYEKYYDKALYMLAWAHYNLDRFEEAIRLFDSLVVWADKNKERAEEFQELRPEAISYIAISFAEAWEGDPPGGDPVKAFQRFLAFYNGRDQEDHTREVYQKLAEMWFDAGKAGNREKLEGAITVYKEMLTRWPYHADNPQVQDRIITCMVYLRDQQRAIVEREKLARAYAKGTQWYEKNRRNRAALRAARNLAEGNMIEAALHHHKLAQNLREKAEAEGNDELMRQAVKEYTIAAEHYQRFLQMYPTSKLFYEYSYSLADTYYFSFRFEEAATQYRTVRDSNLDNKYFEEAASGVVLAYEKAIQLAVQKGTLKEPPLPTAQTVTPPVKPLPVADLYLKLQAAYDWYTPRFPKSPRNADRMYEAALISYRALKFPDARQRFEKILKRYCKQSAHGIDAGNALLNTYIIESGESGARAKEIEEWTGKLQAMDCGAITAGRTVDPETEKKYREQRETLKKLNESILLQKGEQAAKTAKWEEAAAIFETHVAKYPKSKKRLGSLKNLAVCYEHLQKYGQATRAYERIFTEYANDRVEAPRAIWNAAAAYDRFFDFDRAVSLYRRLADSSRYAAWADPAEPKVRNRNEAILRAADIRARDNSYRDAAQLYRRYADETRNRPTKKTAAALHLAAKQYVAMKDRKGTIAAFEEFIRRYNSNRGKEITPLVIEAYYRIAEAHEARGRIRATKQAYAKVVTEAMLRGVKPGSTAAEHAAQAQFKLVDPQYQAFVRYKFVSSDNPKKAKRSLDDITRMMKSLQVAYSRVIAWNRPEWVTAAGYRTGETYRLGARKLLDAPPPPKIVKIDRRNPDAGILGQYEEVMIKQAEPAEKLAQEQWVKVLQYAKKVPLSNHWTKLSQTRLHDYQPEKYATVRDEKVEFQIDNP